MNNILESRFAIISNFMAAKNNSTCRNQPMEIDGGGKNKKVCVKNILFLSYIKFYNKLRCIIMVSYFNAIYFVILMAICPAGQSCQYQEKYYF